MPVKDVVLYLANRRATGTLHLERGAVKKQVAVSGGVVVDASSNQPRELLGQILLNLGHVTEEQFNRAYDHQKKHKVFLGKILVDQGVIASDTLRMALSMKFRETLLDAFTWEDGTFRFLPDQIASPPEGQTFQLELLDIHKEGEFRETAWRAMRAAFPSGSARLTVDERRLHEPPTPGSLDERLLQLAREGLSIDEMVLALHATDFHLYQRLYALFRQDILKLRVEEEMRTVAVVTGGDDDLSVSELVTHAQGYAAAGNLRGAEVLARKALELSKTPDTEAVVKDLGNKLSAILKEVLMGRGAPVLTQGPDALKTLPLAAAERYLLSRVAGKRTLETIIQVSPLQELEALKAFDMFLTEGWISFDKPSQP